MTADTELLRQYADEGDEDAFAEVVRRQVDFVYSTALRVTAGDSHLAQDVAQRVFTKMAQHAGQLGKYETIVGWLHLTARNTAIKTIRGEQRRRAREEEAFLMQNQPATTDVNWEQLRPMLDEAVDELAEPDRYAVLLRFFKGLSHREVGDELGLTEDTARKRVERALEKLREHFARRGVTVSSALLAAAISANSLQAAPTPWAETVAGASLANTATGAGSTLLATLLMSTKIKFLLAIAAVAAVVTTLTLALQSGPDKTAAPPLVETASAPPPPPVPMAIRQATSLAVPSVPGPAFPATAPAKTAATTTEKPPVSESQAELNGSIAKALRLLKEKNYDALFEAFVPPPQREKANAEFADAGTSFAQYFEQSGKADKMLAAMEAAQNLAPEIEGDRATYNFTGPDGKPATISFLRVDGLWYVK